jgi:hypothetical protein
VRWPLRPLKDRPQASAGWRHQQLTQQVSPAAVNYGSPVPAERQSHGLVSFWIFGSSGTPTNPTPELQPSYLTTASTAFLIALGCAGRRGALFFIFIIRAPMSASWFQRATCDFARTYERPGKPGLRWCASAGAPPGTRTPNPLISLITMESSWLKPETLLDKDLCVG